MKKFFLISFSLIIHFGLHASPEGEEDKFISQAMTISGPVIERIPVDLNDNLESSKKNDSKSIEVKTNSKVDSSYYSVNKFNFVFYLMYKLKYLDENNIKLPKKPLEQDKD